MKLLFENWRKYIDEDIDEGSNFFDNMRAKQQRCKGKPKTGDCAEDRPTSKQWKKITAEKLSEEEFYEVDAKDINE